MNFLDRFSKNLKKKPSTGSSVVPCRGTWQSKESLFAILQTHSKSGGKKVSNNENLL